MSGIDEPGTPPEVPEEYAAIYRDAYERALAEEDDPGLAADLLGPGAVRRAPPERPAWLVPAAVGAAVVLVLCAFVLAKTLSSDDSTSASEEPAATTSRLPASGTPTHAVTKKPTKAAATKAASRTPYAGPVLPVDIDGITATCTAPPGVDSAGRPVRYDAGNAIDRDPSTAWRCDGSATGTVLRLTLPAGTQVARVGLVPGYAKTDPRSGADRYAENNRITRVRWTLADGTVVEQRLDPDPARRAVQVLRVPRTKTGRISLQIESVDRGARNTTAISSIVVYRAR